MSVFLDIGLHRGGLHGTVGPGKGHILSSVGFLCLVKGYIDLVHRSHRAMIEERNIGIRCGGIGLHRVSRIGCKIKRTVFGLGQVSGWILESASVFLSNFGLGCILGPLKINSRLVYMSNQFRMRVLRSNRTDPTFLT